MNARQPPVAAPFARVLIVDDHPLVREGLATRIAAQRDLVVSGEAADARQALELIAASPPDAAIIDIALAHSNGLELVKEIKARHPRIRMLVVSGYDESLYAERALRAGALGYINKRECQENIIEALRTVLAGRRYVSRDMAQRLFECAMDDKPLDADPVAGLSDRELEVFQMIGQGMKSGAIATALSISVHTVESHREKIRAKLHLRDGAELTRRAVQWSLERS